MKWVKKLKSLPGQVLMLDHQGKKVWVDPEDLEPKTAIKLSSPAQAMELFLDGLTLNDVGGEEPRRVAPVCLGRASRDHHPHDLVPAPESDPRASGIAAQLGRQEEPVG